MGLLTWTKTWSAADNGTILTGAHLGTIQSDIAAIINGGLTNANIDASAAIEESKLAFDSSTGHTHNGVDSRLVSVSFMKHYRKGCTIKQGTTADEHIKINPGTLEIGGTVLSSVAVSADIDIAAGESWVNGSATNSIWVYVYAYNNSGTLAFKLSTEAPNLAYSDDTTAESVLRYRAYTSVYYRCIGAVFIDAAGDLCWGQASSEGLYVSQFDASNVCIIGGLGTGSDQTMVTLWTPKSIKVIFGYADNVPAVGDKTWEHEATKQMMDTNWYATQLNATHFQVGPHEWRAITEKGSINAITAQAAGTAGSFTIDAMDDGYYWYAIAHTDEV